MPKTIRGVLSHFSPDSYYEKQIRAWIRKNFAIPLLDAYEQFEKGGIDEEQYDAIKESLIFSYRKMMEDLKKDNGDKGWDYYDRRWYPIVVGFFRKERDKLNLMLRYFSNTTGFKGLKNSGASEDDLFRFLEVNCLRSDVFPLIADSPQPYMEGEVKVLERPDYLDLIYSRTSRIASEIETKMASLKDIDQHIPVISDLKRPELKDGALFELPPTNQCVICKAQGREVFFEDQSKLVEHYLKEHRKEHTSSSD